MTTLSHNQAPVPESAQITSPIIDQCRQVIALINERIIDQPYAKRWEVELPAGVRCVGDPLIRAIHEHVSGNAAFELLVGLSHGAADFERLEPLLQDAACPAAQRLLRRAASGG